MSTLIIHRVKEVKIEEPRKFDLKGLGIFYWQTITIIDSDGNRVRINLESDKPMLNESMSFKEYK